MFDLKFTYVSSLRLVCFSWHAFWLQFVLWFQFLLLWPPWAPYSRVAHWDIGSYSLWVWTWTLSSVWFGWRTSSRACFPLSRKGHQCSSSSGTSLSILQVDGLRMLAGLSRANPFSQACFLSECVYTLIGSILRKISKLPSDGQKTKKLGINGHINISKGHQILT